MVLDKIFYFKNWRFQNRKSLELTMVEKGNYSEYDTSSGFTQCNGV
ncbi:MAG TPA: hypothetical protein PLH25_05925 [Flavobacterium sp.]|nr:hypothetical protein [Flavobacterium sp.]